MPRDRDAEMQRGREAERQRGEDKDRDKEIVEIYGETERESDRELRDRQLVHGDRESETKRDEQRRGET